MWIPRPYDVIGYSDPDTPNSLHPLANPMTQAEFAEKYPGMIPTLARDLADDEDEK